jgi:hypothetical protein
VVAGEGGQVCDFDDDQSRRPGLTVDGRTRVRARWIPGDELARPHEAPLATPARTHRVPGDDAEDVLAARLDGVASGAACHQQHACFSGRTPYPDLFGRHAAIVGGKNVQDRAIRRA